MRRLGQEKKGSFFVFKIFLIALVVAVLAYGLVKLFGLERFFFKGPQTVVQLITDSGLKSDHDRINMLLLGTGGQGHDGPDLTDTIILASIDKDGDDTALISIPRDLWAPSLEAKINHAYAFGREKDGNGLELAKDTVRRLFDLPIHYAVRVDFDGFIKAVDLVDGLDIVVEHTFVDPKYPIPGKEDELCGLTIENQEIDGIQQEVVKDATGSAMPLSQITDQNNPFLCRYETLEFVQGPLHLDGITALKFVRSRHGTNGEGSDFARSARQQKIILAFRDKVFSTGTLANPKTIIDLITTFDASIDTDIQNDEIPLFVKLSQKIDPTKIRTVVLDSDRENSVLVDGNPADYGGQFVLEPKDGTWTDLAEYVQSEIFKLEEK
jgi:anionic cell wall polymer biosynthesis LytR-Cps2A-Psr (LCP) family protein